MLDFRYSDPLISASLIRRYKRFLADVAFDDGATATAHVANSGAMTGCAEPGSRVWLSANRNPRAKLAWRWELVETADSLVGVNTLRANSIAESAIRAGRIPELAGYASLRREVGYGDGSRIDLLLEDPGRCYVEIKSVTLRQGDAALFPDAVSKRGAKHLDELAAVAATGARAVVLFVVQREDCNVCGPAVDIDPAFAAAVARAEAAGVTFLARRCTVRHEGIGIAQPLSFQPAHSYS